jgi:hypothetical protein
MCRVVNVDRRLGQFPGWRFERQRLCDQRCVFGDQRCVFGHLGG